MISCFRSHSLGSCYHLPGSASPRHVTGGNSSSHWQNLSLMSRCLLIAWKPAHALPSESIFRSGLMPFALPWAFQKKRFLPSWAALSPFVRQIIYLYIYFFSGHKIPLSRSPELYIFSVPCSQIRACIKGKHLAVLDQAFRSIVPWLPRQFISLASCLRMWLQLHQHLLPLSSQWAKFCLYLDQGTASAELRR